MQRYSVVILENVSLADKFFSKMRGKCDEKSADSTKEVKKK